DPFKAIHLFRIAQEGLQNAIRHAGGAQVMVRLRGHSDVLTISIEDDGAFRTPDGTGHGLTAMRTRADEIGAVLDLDATPRGTTVRVTWPGEIARMEDSGGDGQRAMLQT
ncbi:MAG TPA: ATP-binding protein, partial [Rhodothermales bacterium]|nr:ATP-binding protein [Rhodothermales bacterium]